MKKMFFYLSAVILTLQSSLIYAKDVSIHNAWVRSAPPNAPALGVFMTIKNDTYNDINLVKASADGYSRVELHRTTNENGVMKMVKQDYMPIAANGQLDLKPGSWHIMLINPESVPAKGEQVKINLEFDNNTSVTVNAIVKKGARDHNMQKHAMGMNHGMGHGMGRSMDHGMSHHKMGHNMGMAKKMKMMKHASPMPNLMKVVIKHADKLNLSKNQSNALAKWRKNNGKRVAGLVKKVHMLEKQIYNATMVGKSKDYIMKLANEALQNRYSIIYTKLRCRDNMRKILNNQQYNKVVNLYQKMMAK